MYLLSDKALNVSRKGVCSVQLPFAKFFTVCITNKMKQNLNFYSVWESRKVTNSHYSLFLKNFPVSEVILYSMQEPCFEGNLTSQTPVSSVDTWSKTVVGTFCSLSKTNILCVYWLKVLYSWIQEVGGGILHT